ncbi:unnamed protein product [Alopecurus aequalis]
MVVVAVLLSTAAEAALPPAMVLERAQPLKGVPVNQLREMDRARHARRGVVNFSVEGSGSLSDKGLYYTRVKLGSPSKKYTFQIDTGSSIPWVACKGCTGCSTKEQSFLNRCTNSLSHLMATDGLLGFGQDPLSIVSQLNSQGVSPKAFSHCLKGSEDGGGTLVLGKIVAPELVYTPLVPSQSLYYLNLESIAVNGRKLPIDSSLFATSNSQGTVVDSGTTLAYLVDGAHGAFVRGIEAPVTASVLSLDTPENGKRAKCYLAFVSIDLLFPMVTLYFKGGAAMTVKPSQYLVRLGSNGNGSWWCLGWLSSDDLPNIQGMTLLGDIVLHDKLIVYDLGKRRLGWTDYNCKFKLLPRLITRQDQLV